MGDSILTSSVLGQSVTVSGGEGYGLASDFESLAAADSSREVITSDVDGFAVLHSVNSILEGGVSVLSNRGNSGRVLGNGEFAETIGVGEGSDFFVILTSSYSCDVLVAFVLDVDLIISIYGKGRWKLKADFHGLDVGKGLFGVSKNN